MSPESAKLSVADGTVFFVTLRDASSYKYEVVDWQIFLWDMRYLLDHLRKLHGIFG